MSEERVLVMGTRGSPLALAQARQVAALLSQTCQGLRVEERIIRTSGDKQQVAPLPAIGGKGLFTLEIEDALLSGDIDFAVHSLKDLPPDMPAGLCLASVPQRQDASDVCVLSQRTQADASTQNLALPFLPRGARVGTSSLRRAAQLLHVRPDLQIANIRGNIDTRLRKLEEENFDATILAAAGLNRLGAQFPNAIHPLDQQLCVPSPGQGALALQARERDSRVLEILALVENANSRAEIVAERAAMKSLNAGCSTPLGARAAVQVNVLHLWAAVLSVDGKERIFAQAEGGLAEAAQVGEEVARQLQAQGAQPLMS